MWITYALLSAFFAALVAIFAKLGMSKVDSDLATAIRTVVILVLAWSIAWFRGKLDGIVNLDRSAILFLVLSGLATGFSWLFYFRAMQMGKVSQVAPIDKLSLAIVIVLSALFLGEAITWKVALGAALIIAGTIVVII
ncbi:MAG TPA: EamA family transporter [Leptospiraceae bacterium]|jgi:transporter family protein|nr:EamA family transporter [Leptospirales bacterium]HMU82758.1 EamA family transporter [Leptospiraceae bacterium]HMW59566.1 EamA family transporter [Leptospiraceae bacterium]HMX56432.1 EamA family transporter [Leptospiraceae bacterium]HMZ35187.1 EamA family transporter [Leptospiraceae bacterium]